MPGFNRNSSIYSFSFYYSRKYSSSGVLVTKNQLHLKVFYLESTRLKNHQNQYIYETLFELRGKLEIVECH